MKIFSLVMVLLFSVALHGQEDNELYIAIPHAIERSISVSFPGWSQLENIERSISTIDGQKMVYYSVKLKKEDKEFMAVLDPKGNLMEIKPYSSKKKTSSTKTM